MGSDTWLRAVRACGARLGVIEKKQAEGPRWLSEEHGKSRWLDIIINALDRFNYDQDPEWVKPYVYQGMDYAPLEKLAQEYSEEAIEFACTISEAIVLVDTYPEASDLAFRMMKHLPNPHQAHMGGIAIYLDEGGIEPSRTERTLRPCATKGTDEQHQNKATQTDVEAFGTGSDPYTATATQAGRQSAP